MQTAAAVALREVAVAGLAGGYERSVSHRFHLLVRHFLRRVHSVDVQRADSWVVLQNQGFQSVGLQHNYWGDRDQHSVEKISLLFVRWEKVLWWRVCKERILKVGMAVWLCFPLCCVFASRSPPLHPKLTSKLVQNFLVDTHNRLWLF